MPARPLSHWGPLVTATRVQESPRVVGVATQALCVYVQDLQAHFEHARAANATITSEPEDTDFGSREYHVQDLEGHSWTFGTYLPSVGRE
jgi:uncharacterized glyoxalase superfamily protein PhnB